MFDGAVCMSPSPNVENCAVSCALGKKVIMAQLPTMLMKLDLQTVSAQPQPEPELKAAVAAPRPTLGTVPNYPTQL